MIYGIGRNYASHAKELGNTAPSAKGNPMVFFKPMASIVQSGTLTHLPAFSNNVHYECELAFKFGAKLDVSEIAVANDLTARDKQREAQEAKAPWSLGKGFKQSCGLGNWVQAAGIDLTKLELRLTLNGKLVQHGYTKDMIFDIPALVAFLTTHFPVQPGDICLTGTPEGVGPVVSGDTLIGEIIGYSTGQWKFA